MQNLNWKILLIICLDLVLYLFCSNLAKKENWQNISDAFCVSKSVPNNVKAIHRPDGNKDTFSHLTGPLILNLLKTWFLLKCLLLREWAREQGRERGQISCPTSLPNVSVCLANKEAAWKEKILNFYSSLRSEENLVWSKKSYGVAQCQLRKKKWKKREWKFSSFNPKIISHSTVDYSSISLFIQYNVLYYRHCTKQHCWIY